MYLMLERKHKMSSQHVPFATTHSNFFIFPDNFGSHFFVFNLCLVSREYFFEHELGPRVCAGQCALQDVQVNALVLLGPIHVTKTEVYQAEATFWLHQQIGGREVAMDQVVGVKDN